jgi:hypothetical protein
MVPVQNNLAADLEWCYPCNEAHNQTTCTNGMINQALMVQNIVMDQQNATTDVLGPQHDLHAPEIVFLS